MSGSDSHMHMLMNPRKMSDDEDDALEASFKDYGSGQDDEEDASSGGGEGRGDASVDGDDDGDDGDDGDDDDDGGDDGDSASEQHSRHHRDDRHDPEPRTPVMSREEVNNAKRELMYRFDRLEKKGVRVPRKYSMASDLADMQADYERLVKDRDADAGIRFQKQVLVTFVSGVEYLNRRFDHFDFHLDGWSETVNENIGDYDDVLEELHAKYRGKAKMAPELKLLMMIVGSAFMYHMTNTMFKNVPALGQVVKDNPALMKQFAAATANTMQKQGTDKTGLAGMFSSLFGGFGGPAPPPPEPAQPQPPLRGPSSSRVAEVQRFMSQTQGGAIPTSAYDRPMASNGREFRHVPQQAAPSAPPRAAKTPVHDMRGDPAIDDDLVDIMSAASSEITTGGRRRKRVLQL